MRQLEHETSVLSTEVQALSMKLEQQVSARKEDKEAWERALDTARGCTRAVEFERDAMAEKCNVYLRELEAGKDDKQRLQARPLRSSLMHGDCADLLVAACARTLLLPGSALHGAAGSAHRW